MIGLMFVQVKINTPRGCFQPPCPQSAKIPLGVIILHKLFPNSFIY